MANGQIQIYKIEYDRPNDPNHYVVYLGAFNQNEATNHVMRRTGGSANITGFSHEGGLNEFTPEVINSLKNQVLRMVPNANTNATVEDVILAENKKLEDQQKKVKGRVRK